jgi:hypothetical protein
MIRMSHVKRPRPLLLMWRGFSLNGGAAPLMISAPSQRTQEGTNDDATSHYDPIC